MRTDKGSVDHHFPQSGAILIDKPEGITSSDVVFTIKKSLSAGSRLPWGFKIGHAGTLDPFATGLLVLFYGEATKLSNAYLKSKKTYLGQIQLGTQTDTADHTGQTTQESPIPPHSLEEWQALTQMFTEVDYFQTPPMYSAKRKNGIHLYELAREGLEVDREAILKTIYSFTLKQPSPGCLDFEVCCESGTYVRTLAEDLAKKAGTHAHLKTLRRAVSSDFDISQAVPLQVATEILSSSAEAGKSKFVLPLNRVGAHLPSLSVSSDQEAGLRQGHLAITQGLLNQAKALYPETIYALIRASDQFPVGLIHEFKLQRILNRPMVPH